MVGTVLRRGAFAAALVVRARVSLRHGERTASGTMTFDLEHIQVEVTDLGFDRAMAGGTR